MTSTASASRPASSATASLRQSEWREWALAQAGVGSATASVADDELRRLLELHMRASQSSSDSATQGPRAVVAGARRDLQGRDDRVAALEAENEILRAQIADMDLRLRLRSSTKASDRAQHEQAMQEHGDAVAHLRRELADLTDKLAAHEQRASDEISREQTLRVELLAKYDAALMDAASSQSTVTSLQSRLADTERELREARSEASSRQTAMAADLASIQELRESVAALEAELSATRRCLNDRTTAMEQSQRRIEAEVCKQRELQVRLLTEEGELRVSRSMTAAAEARALTFGKQLADERDVTDALRRQVASLETRVSEAEARVSYMRSTADGETTIRDVAVAKARAEVARAMASKVLRLVVVTPTVSVQLPAGATFTVRAVMPEQHLRKVLHESILPAFVRIFRRDEAVSATPGAEEPWLRELVEDMEAGIEEQLRATFE